MRFGFYKPCLCFVLWGHVGFGSDTSSKVANVSTNTRRRCRETTDSRKKKKVTCSSVPHTKRNSLLHRTLKPREWRHVLGWGTARSPGRWWCRVLIKLWASCPPTQTADNRQTHAAESLHLTAGSAFQHHDESVRFSKEQGRRHL